MRIGLLGGAFNPPHLGHLILAQEAFVQLELERVVLMPYGEPSHRVLDDDPGADARLTMCEYAFGADERFAVSSLEVDRAGPIYTIDTLRQLVERDDVDEVVLILGGDQAAALGTWRSPEEVLALAVLGVAERDEWTRSTVAESLGSLCTPDRVRFFSMPRVDVSSSLVRSRARAGLPIRYLVPDKVANYVGAQSLYGAAVPPTLGGGSAGPGGSTRGASSAGSPGSRSPAEAAR